MSSSSRARVAGRGVLGMYPLTINRRASNSMAGAVATFDRLTEFRNRILTSLRGGPIRMFVQAVVRMDSPAESVLFNITTGVEIVVNKRDIDLQLAYLKDKLWERAFALNERSGLVLSGVDALRLVISRHRPQGGGTYIALPEELARKKVLINVRNTDNYCFLYCLLLHKHRDEIGAHPERPTKYARYRDEFKRLAGMCLFPMDPDHPDMDRIETWYKLPINVYIIDETGAVVPRRISRVPAMQTLEGQASACNLLLISNGVKHHYVYITKLNALCARGRGKRVKEDVEERAGTLDELLNHKPKRVCRRGNEKTDMDASEGEVSSSDTEEEEEQPVIGTRDSRHMCCFCMNGFASSEKLKDHIDGGCGTGEVNCVREIYPEPLPSGDAPTIEWRDGCKQATVGKIRVYADFESIMVDEEGYTEVLLDNESSTRRVSVHRVCSAAYTVVAPGTTLDGVQWLSRASRDMHCGDLVVTHLLYSLFELYRSARKEIKALECLPVFFHNLSGYDGHFITLALGRVRGGLQYQRKTVIAKNTESFSMISLGPLRFLDSLSLLGPGMGLATAVRNLSDDGKDYSKFSITRGQFQNCTDESLLFKKGEYPYDYFTTTAKFEERALPPASEFRSKLDCEVTRAELETRHAIATKAWETFRCGTLGDYHDMYLRLDVALLADVFEAHRDMCMAEYGLDPGNGVFLSLPNFSWFAMLKKTGVKLEQITNPDIYQMIERGKRGGQAIITRRHAQANNRYMDTYDRRKPESYIMYLDANNLYGLAMSRKLPISGFRFATSMEVAEMLEETSRGVWRLKELPDDVGCFVEADLDYPESLHDEHNDYPLAPVQMAVKESQLSDMQCLWLAEMGKARNADTDKLCGTLSHKRKYVVHIDLLRFYLDHGLVLKHVHRVIMFKQAAWLEPYIRFNTERRALATTKAAKEFYKLLNNAVFGKTMENVRNRSNLTLVSDRKTLLKMVSRPHYKAGIIFREDDEDGNFLVGVSMHATSVKLDKPVYAGVSILDLSKLHMYWFHYDRVKPLWGPRAHLLFTDTDSLCYWIETSDAYEDMCRELVDDMDMSELNRESRYCFTQALTDEELAVVDENARRNKKVLGKFKDETGGVPITEFVGLRAKCYSFVTCENHTETKAKGVNRQALKAYLSHQDYKHVLAAPVGESKLATFHSFRSVLHQVTTVQVTKQALNKYDDKRFILPDGITTRAHGHYLNRG